MRRQRGTARPRVTRLAVRPRPSPPDRSQRAASAQRGNALAEFALVLPLLLMFVFGIIELGFAFTSAQAVEAAAREGARLASLSSTDAADVVVRVEETLATAPLDSDPVVTISPGSCAGRQGESVTVTVSGIQRISIPFVLEREVALTSEAVFRCEA